MLQYTTEQILQTTTAAAPTTAAAITQSSPAQQTTLNNHIATFSSNASEMQTNFTTADPFLPEIFLQTTGAKVVAGLCAFSAMVITVHQVR